MDWSNRFTFGGFTVTYSTFQMTWEVIEKKGDYEVAFRWFYSKQKAEGFCLGRIARLNHKRPRQGDFIGAGVIFKKP